MKNLILYSLFIMLFSSCADSVNFSEAASMQAVGFWYGLWHGWIVGFAWIVSLFSDSTAIYAIYNNGGWYDFGFMLGAGLLGGTVTEIRRQ